MKSTTEYIDESIIKLGLANDNQLAKRLGYSSGAFSNYRSKNRIIDDYTAAKLAEILGIPPIEVIAAANAEREKDSQRRDFWENLRRTTAAGLLAVLATGAGTYRLDAERDESNTLYIMRNFQERRRWRPWARIMRRLRGLPERRNQNG